MTIKNILIKIMVNILAIPFIIYCVLLFPYYFLRKTINRRKHYKKDTNSIYDGY